MIQQLDLFHQFYFADQGFTAIIDYCDSFPQVDIYTPDGEWCGCTNASSDASRMAAVREIINKRIAYDTERRLQYRLSGVYANITR